MRITDVRINGIVNPVGFCYDRLICSWKAAETKSLKQEYACIEVSETPLFETLIYKTEGKDLDQAGEALELELKPRASYYLRVTVTGDQQDSATSETATFETGKMCEFWGADWITTSSEDHFHPVFEKCFLINKPVRRARLYCSGVGLFEAYLNGEKLGEEYLAPYMTDYEKTIQVLTFPLEHQLKQENILTFLVAKGWYMGTFGLELNKNNYGDAMAVIGELYLEYEDGSTKCIQTNDSFVYYGSDIEDSGIYDGEICNRLLWDGLKNEKKPVLVVNQNELCARTRNLRKENLKDRISLPILAKEEIPVKEVIYTPAGEAVFDLGQNFAGFIEFKAELPKGSRIVLEHGEILQHGNFYNKNYRDAKSQFVYISNGESEVVRSHFTYFGFRYVRISGWPDEIHKENFVGKVLYSDLTRTGYLETSNEKVNRLYENTLWGLKSNFMDLPTDCPQRSERLGWTGDAQVFAPTACYHMDTRAFFHKFIQDLKQEQELLDGGVPNYLPNLGHKRDVGSVWGDIASLLPDTLYRFYGSRAEAEYAYPMMKGWVDYIDREDTKRGRKFLFDFGFSFGDWLALDGPTPTSFKGSTDDAYISSVYYYRSTQIVKEMSALLGKKEEETHYFELEQRIGQAIFREFFTPSGRLAVDTQAAYIIALKFGIYIDRERTIEQFKRRLSQDCNQIKCGFVGAPLLCTVLAEADLYELAYDFLLKEGFPGWLYGVNLGATTVWERWNSVLEDGTISDTGMNSLNHYAYGSVMEFLYAYAAGIRPCTPGYKTASIKPHPDVRFSYMNCRYESVNGTYVCNWKIETNGSLHIQITIPFNCQAEVVLPESGRDALKLSAGNYDFSYTPLKDYRTPYGMQTTLSRLAKDKQAMGILGHYAPALAGIASSGDLEMGAKTLGEISSMFFLPFNPKQLEQAITEISQINIMENAGEHK